VTIRHAQAASTYAGIKCVSASPTIRNCILRDNYSGIYLDNSSAALTDCQGIYNSNYGLTLSGSSAPVVSGGVFSNNGSYGVQCNNTGSTVLQNCVMARNANSGVYAASSAHVAITNCTLVGNTSRGIYAYNTSTDVDVSSCILWNNNDDLLNCTATFSCIEDSDTGRGNIHTDPLFQDAAADDFHLDVNSPCIDAGAPWFEYANEPSPNGGRVNLGAYGNTAEATTSTDVDGDGISDIWEVAHWPSDDPNLHNPTDNPDGDRLTNWSEYLFGTDPVTAEPSETLQIHYGARSASAFDPTQGQTVTIQYWVNIDANAVITIAEAGNPGNVIAAIDQSAYVGRNQWVWDGRDANGLIVEHGFYDITVDANDGVDTANYDCGTVELTYPHRVSNVQASPCRFIPTYDEITTITYDVTVDANMVVSIYDPTGQLFRTLTAPQADPNEVVWDGRNKDAEQPDSRYISKDGTYRIEVRYEGMREKEEGVVTVYK
jgi:parallel beta-helix repeat protein